MCAFSVIFTQCMNSKYVLCVCRFAVVQRNVTLGHTLTTWACARAERRVHGHTHTHTHTHPHSHIQINKWLHFCVSHSCGQRWKVSLFGLFPPADTFDTFVEVSDVFQDKSQLVAVSGFRDYRQA